MFVIICFIVSSDHPGMSVWLNSLFAFLASCVNYFFIASSNRPGSPPASPRSTVDVRINIGIGQIEIMRSGRSSGGAKPDMLR